MATSLEELITNRKMMLDVLELNNSAQGIQRVLTDLYPDTAHFVYELLQNAEDAGATSVKFSLRPNGVFFAHNGKREFTLDDVDAITAIGGNSAKKDDVTSIGEFGVGFKAVFSYTFSPEIHSGNYHFRIKNHFLVETEGVPQRFLRHQPNEHWTEFDFPFDNPAKPADKAYSETSQGLKKLDETALLFLRNISLIEYEVEGKDGISGYARRTRNEENEVLIACKIPQERERIRRFLLYSEETTITSDRGKTKSLPIAIAYSLVQDKEGNDSIEPIEGKTFIYFPADKEFSRLKFHVNAPFSATVDRASIRDCEDNAMLLEKVARLVANSLASIKAKGLMTSSVYAVMPNESDNLPANYKPILSAVCEAFAKNEYLLAQSGGYVSSTNAVRGPRVFSDFLSEDILPTFAGISGKWIANPPLKRVNHREYAFLDALGINELDSYLFAHSFARKDRRTALLNYASQKDIASLKLLYQAIFVVYSAWHSGENSPRGTNYESRRATFNSFASSLPSAPFLRCIDGKFHAPKESFIMPEGFDSGSITEPIIDKRFVEEKAKTQRYDARGIREMLIKIGVTEYSLEVELNRLIAKYSKMAKKDAESVAKDKAYYADMLYLARAHKKGADANVSDVAIFIGRAQNGKTRFFSINNLVLGSAYGNEHGDSIADFQGLPVIHSVYTKMYKQQEELDCFTDYLKWAGIKTNLEIISCPLKNNPSYARMVSLGGTLTSKGVQFDFTIRGLPESLQGISYEMSYELWRLISEKGATSKFALAYYKASVRSTPQTSDSQLVTHLKNFAWLPNVSGKMHKPGEIAFQELDYAFREIGDGQIVAALQLGSDVSAKKQAENKLKRDAEELGKHVISDEDYKFLQKMREKERLAAERQAERESGQLSVQDLLNKQNRDVKPRKDEDLPLSSGAVNNPEKRSERISQTIKDLASIPSKRQMRFSVVSVASKQEKETLKQWYQGRCQICDTRITRHDGEPYFEAINIINTADLPGHINNSVQLGWNTLSLCPNCAAKYRYCGKKLSGFAEQIAATEIIPGSEELIPVSIELEGRTVDINFIPKHMLALKEGLKCLDNSQQ